MQTINLDLSVRSVVPLLHAKQGDVGRKFKAVLTDNRTAYPVPPGAAVSVWYSGASGVGNYTKIGADSAVSVSDNEITVELIAQMLNNAGEGAMCLIMTGADGYQLGTWNIPYIVEAVPGAGSEPVEQYLGALDERVSDIVDKKPLVKSVNGKAPDENGNVEAATDVESAEHPGCYYRTVDGVTEWLNPPMIAGVEYRTTERYNGKPVYAFLIDFGNLPNASTKSTLYGAEATDVKNVISIEGATNSGEHLPYIAPTAASCIYVTTMSGLATVTTGSDRSKMTGQVLIKYTRRKD